MKWFENPKVLPKGAFMCALWIKDIYGKEGFDIGWYSDIVEKWMVDEDCEEVLFWAELDRPRQVVEPYKELGESIIKNIQKFAVEDSGFGYEDNRSSAYKPG